MTDQPDPLVDRPLEPIAISPPAGTWLRASVYLPHPVTPLLESLWFPMYEDAFRAAYAEFGVLLDANALCSIGGWAYGTTRPLGGRDGGGSPPPWWVLGALARIVPAMRERVRTAVRASRTDASGALVTEWVEHLRPELLDRAHHLRAVELTALTDAELLAHLDDVAALLRDGTTTHFRLALANHVIGAFALVANELLGWDDQQVAATLTGLSPMSSEPARRLAEVGRLPAADQPAAVAAFRAELGTRLAGHDLCDPTIGEIPGLVEQIVEGQLRQGFDPDALHADAALEREAVLGTARAALADRPAGIVRFESALAAAIRVFPLREDNVNISLMAPWGLLRLAVLEAGRRLAAHERLDRTDDACLLTWDELRASVRSSVDRRDLVRTRAAQRRWAEAHPGPPSYGPPFGGMPDLRGFPREVQDMTAATGWVVRRLGAIPTPTVAAAADDRSAPAARGLGTAPGIYEGIVRVIRHEDEFTKLEPGDVLVCPTTTPTWSLLFSMVGALVTDVGALMTHPSIIAREFGIPAVVNTGNGTDVLQDGQRVRVDGARGTVELVP